MEVAKAIPAPTDGDNAFPDLATGPVEVPIPHVTITATAADFTNSRNEVAQLTAWIAKLEHESIVQLLRKLYAYNHGSLYGFMRVWCRVGEGFDIGYDDCTDWTVSEQDAFTYGGKPREDSVVMWQALHKRAAGHTVDLRRVLHFLLFLYSNDRLTTRYSGEFPANVLLRGPGAPGQLVTRMSTMLKEFSQTRLESRFGQPNYVLYPRSGHLLQIRRERRRAFPRAAANAPLLVHRNYIA